MNALDRLGEIRMPTLIFAGRHDWIMPPTEGAERSHRGLPNSRLMIFEQSGHFPFIEERDNYLSAVNSWFDTLA